MQQISIQSLSAMLKFGEQLGHQLQGGEVFDLTGDIGAGKTSFVKGLARGMAIKAVVQSPTFTINRVYDAPNGLRLYHYDFYRLAEPGIMRDELAEALADPQGVIALEWNETVRDLLPPERTLRLHLKAISEQKRQLELAVPNQLAYLKVAA